MHVKVIAIAGEARVVRCLDFEDEIAGLVVWVFPRLALEGLFIQHVRQITQVRTI